MINVNDKLISVWGWNHKDFRPILDEYLSEMRAYVLVMLSCVRVPKVRRAETEKDIGRSPV